MINPKKEESVKKFKLARQDKKYNLIGVVMNKPFVKFTKKNSGINEDTDIGYFDYHLSVFYSNSENKEDVLVEIRNFEDFENIRFSQSF